MTKTDLFRAIIKTFGIYCFIEALFRLIPNISFSGGFYSFSLIVSTVYLLITGFIAFLLLFGTDRIIKLFRLEKGFDSNNIDASHLNEEGLLKLGLILIGLLMIVDNIAQFLNYCYLLFKKQISANGLDEIDGMMLDQQLDYNWWVISGLNVLIGFILLTNYKRISSFFTAKEIKLGDSEE
ncbi:hypothetical protein [Allomuricauda sp. NBRC 101325]|uniref:hypothetical protein n=1 Tax=Allomuricauda sp. NBRC 101325 TaxID=1113758 RepID=UPI0024A53A01|nr:hypothetical protein [Muricauda sp. NBRC 101325]GLU45400.1 hypothetical protein Musp01_30240 [Muricauda sp. NBRC 101325]